MPMSAPVRCASCRQLYRPGPERRAGGKRGGGSCPNCSGWSGRRADPTRGLQWKRIYGTPGLRSAWYRLKAVVRRDMGDACVMCGAPATDVDHIDGTDYADDSGAGSSWLNPSMCRPLCAPCHRTRTARQASP